MIALTWTASWGWSVPSGKRRDTFYMKSSSYSMDAVASAVDFSSAFETIFSSFMKLLRQEAATHDDEQGAQRHTRVQA
jgi:hypothetical protein